MLANIIRAIHYYCGEDEDINVHKPFAIDLYVDYGKWLIITEYEAGTCGGGIAFAIDAQTGELSDYELQE